MEPSEKTRLAPEAFARMPTGQGLVVGALFSQGQAPTAQRAYPAGVVAVRPLRPGGLDGRLGIDSVDYMPKPLLGAREGRLRATPAHAHNAGGERQRDDKYACPAGQGLVVGACFLLRALPYASKAGYPLALSTLAFRGCATAGMGASTTSIVCTHRDSVLGPEAFARMPTGQGLVVGAYNGLWPCAQILQSKINKAAGRERRDVSAKLKRAKATGVAFD